MSGGRFVAAEDNTKETARNVAARKRIFGGFENEIILLEGEKMAPLTSPSSWFTRALPKNNNGVCLLAVPVFVGAIGPVNDHTPHGRTLAKPKVDANVAGTQVT